MGIFHRSRSGPLPARKAMLLYLLSISTGLAAQTSPDKPVAMDPELHYGKLKNGFSYYLKPSDIKAKKIHLTFAVKAGYKHEREDQMELAHLMEHLALRSTKHFPDVKNTLASRGLVFGGDYNGSTEDRKTQYVLTIPSGRPALLDSCLQLIREWAQGGVLLDEGRIDTERGVVIQEIDQAYGTQNLISRKVLTHEIGSGHFTKRMAYDNREQLKKFPYAAVRDFYTDWYVPEMEALIVTGDIDPAKLKQQITGIFSSLKPGRGQQVYQQMIKDMPLKDTASHIILKEPQTEEQTCRIIFKMPYNPVKTYGDYKNMVQYNLLAIMLSNRFNKLKGLKMGPGESVYLNYTPHFSVYGTPFSAIALTIQVDSTKIEDRFTDVTAELERLKRDGFDAAELAIAVKEYPDYYGIKYYNRLMQNLYLSHFTDGSAVPAEQHQTDIVTTLLGQLKVQDMSLLVKQMLEKSPRRTVFLTREDFTAADVRQWVAASRKMKAEKFVVSAEHLETQDKPLLTAADMQRIESLPGADVKVLPKDAYGITHATLPNGIRIMMIPGMAETNATHFYLVRADSVYCRYPADSLLFTNTKAVYNSGFGQYSSKEWMKMINEKELRLFYMTAPNKIGMIGKIPAEEVEILFQTLYLAFTAPRIDTAYLREWKGYQLQPRVLADEPNGETQFRTAITTWYRGEPKKPDPIKIAGMEAERVLSVHRKMFHNDGKLSLVITGNYDSAAVLKMAAKYLAAIPVTPMAAQNQAPCEKKPAEERQFVKKTITSGNGTVSKVFLAFPGQLEKTKDISYRIAVLGQVIAGMVVDRLRYAEGLNYSSGAYVQDGSNEPENDFMLCVEFDCPTEKMKDAVSYVIQEIERAKRGDIPKEKLDAAIGSAISSQTQTMENYDVLKSLLGDASVGIGDLDMIMRYKEYIGKISLDEVKKMVSKFSTEKYTILDLSPEKK